ncbi:MAG: NADPH-dependent FMN reductase [Chitinophagaceae bacterium]
MRIVIISGSPRQNSITRRVAVYLHEYLLQHSEYEIDLLDLRRHNLPPIQSVFCSIDKTPQEYKSVAEKMFEADAFILVSPEYNGSYSPAMKNLLDHFPKQMHKPFGIVTASPGAMGGIRASQQMQLLVNALFGIASPQMLIVPNVDKKFNELCELTEAGFEKNIHQFVTEFLWLAEKLVEEKVIA